MSEDKKYWNPSKRAYETAAERFGFQPAAVLRSPDEEPRAPEAPISAGEIEEIRESIERGSPTWLARDAMRLISEVSRLRSELSAAWGNAEAEYREAERLAQQLASIRSKADALAALAEEAAAEIEAEVHNRYGNPVSHPAYEHKAERDLQLPRDIHAALAEYRSTEENKHE